MIPEWKPAEPIVRKVQLTGGSTYTVSIPKEWATEQEIEPGCSVDLYARPDRLVVARGELDDASRVAEIQVGSNTPADLARYVTAAYVSGCDELRIDGALDTDRRRAVLDATSGLIGFETTVADGTGVVVRSMLDPSELSLEQTLAQMKITALSMQQDAIGAVVSDTDADGIAGQDDDVDRLFGLVCRQFQRSLVDPGTPMESGALTTFEYYTAARQLERIADHAEKTANVALRLEEPLPTEIGERLIELSDRARNLVEDALSGLLDGGDPARMSGVVDDAEPLSQALTELDRELYERQLADGYLLGTVVDSLSRTVDYGVNIAEAGLQASVRESARVLTEIYRSSVPGRVPYHNYNRLSYDPDQLLTWGRSTSRRSEHVSGVPNAASLASASDTLSSIADELATLEKNVESERNFGALDAYYMPPERARARLRGTLAERQAALVEQRRSLTRSACGPDIPSYLYSELSVRHPIVSTAAELLTETDRVERSIAFSH